MSAERGCFNYVSQNATAITVVLQNGHQDPQVPKH